MNRNAWASATVEVAILVCLTVLAAIGRIPPEALLTIATMTATGYAVAKRGGPPGPPQGPGQLGGKGGETTSDAPPPASTRLSSVLTATGVGALVMTLLGLVLRHRSTS